MIDDAALALGALGEQHLLNDLRQGVRLALDGAGERITTERTEAHALQHRLLTRLERHAIVVDHDQNPTAFDDRPEFGEIERHDGDLFRGDIFPNVELGPIRQRKDPHRLALRKARVIESPEFRPLVLRVPAMLGAAQRENAFLGTALLLVAPRTAESGIEAVAVERLLVAHPLIGQALAYGDGRPYVVALLTLDGEAAPAWARARGITAGSLAALASDPQVLAEVAAGVAAANERLARVQQVKRWRLLPVEWTAETEELTPTLKLKRRIVHAKYADVIDSLYAG